MDTSRLGEIIRRNKLLIAVGIVVALALGALTFVTTKPVYQSNSVLFLTQEGFPWGRVTIAPPDGSSGNFGDPDRFIQVASIWTGLATSDAVRREVLKTGEIKGDVSAVTLDSTAAGFGGGGAPLPLMQIGARASSKQDAVDLANRWTAAFTQYMKTQQRAAGISRDSAIILEQIRQPDINKVEIVRPRSLTRPIAIILGVGILFGAIISAVDKGRQRRLARADSPKPAESTEPVGT